ncbi:hypothetical protein FHS95_000584 [Sphingomonas naasensis]|uniref:Uncharacterized protein n=1 Tax=Sphingomonas naasensis TaxID=1344951 RepID=A0A4S1WRX6_9SPHN|nr:hypothetical protein [Sphingomonas naasensis]NIJ18915.1 hypothetical protein [Sphingomonas naasensis]TGX46134.1 hypothetical protein E5A74_02920 [Sphingomonas naasensis]
MVAASLLLFAALVQSSPGAAPVVPLGAQAAAERASRCGVGPVTATYAEELQDEILAAPGATAASDAQLRCLDAAAAPFEVALPPAAQPRFGALRLARESASNAVEARAWLSARGLLARVPAYAEGTTDGAAFVAAIERLCGPRANGAILSDGDIHTFRQTWLQREIRSRAAPDETLRCLLSATKVANFPLVMLGNESLPAD